MVSDDRKKHVFAVANFLKQYAEQQNMSKQEIEDLFVLGLLHDVGYAFAQPNNTHNHHKIGGEILKKQNYKYWQEVFYHGEPNSPYQSKFLDLLNWADLHIDAKGEYVEFDQRLQDISTRHNKPIEQLPSTAVVCELRKKGYN